MSNPLSSKLTRWRARPDFFVEEVLRDPSAKAPFILYREQRAFLQKAFALGEDGRLKFPELLFSAGKKAGKTSLASWCAIYVALVIGGPFAEVYICSNDYEQSVSRVFTSAARIIEASPLLASSAKILSDRITFCSTGSFIQAVASEYKSFAGGNPSLTVFDELWGFETDRAERLWSEGVPSPARQISGRLTTTYAGFLLESKLLRSLYERGLKGEEISSGLFEQAGMLAMWLDGDRSCPAPWQTPEWIFQMSEQLSNAQFRRMIRNEWVSSSEDALCTPEEWAAVTNVELRPVISDPALPVFAALDASVRSDYTAIAVCAYDRTAAKVVQITHYVFRPLGADIDFGQVENTLLELRGRFDLRLLWCDPYQAVGMIQRLQALGVPACEYPQTPSNLTAATSNLRDLIRYKNLSTYESEELLSAVTSASIRESGRGLRLEKVNSSARIDLAVALSMASLAASRFGPSTLPVQYEQPSYDLETMYGR